MSAAANPEAPMSVRDQVVIVGAGPAGLGCALLLAKHGYTDVHVLESRPALDWEQPDRSYCYMVNARGQRFLESVGLMDELPRRSVATGGGAPPVRASVIRPSGRIWSTNFGLTLGRRTSYWLPRRSLLQLMGEAAAAYPGIHIHLGATVTCIERPQPPPSATAAVSSVGTAVNAYRLIVTATVDGSSTSSTVHGESGDSGDGGDGGKAQPFSAAASATTATAASAEVLKFNPRLLVGADGIHSMVRAHLQRWDDEDAALRGEEVRKDLSFAAAGKGASNDDGGGSIGPAPPHGAAREEPEGSNAVGGGSGGSSGTASTTTNNNRFAVRCFDSESAGLRFKVLRLPPNPIMTKAPGAQPVPNASFAVLYSALEHRRDEGIHLGLLPVADPTAPRTGNVITRAEGHKFWGAADGDAVYAYLERAFPQMPVRQLVPPEEADRFARSPGGAFPQPQYCESFYDLRLPPAAAGTQPPPPLQQHQHQQLADTARRFTTTAPEESPVEVTATGAAGSDAATAAAGVLLLGDAIHAFPPDIGQGVNAALEDVTVLGRCLKEHGAANLAAVLPAFQAARKADAVALVDMVRWAFPQQYNQDPPRRLAWAVLHFLPRFALSKLLPSVFNPPAFLLVHDADLSYSEVRRRCAATTRALHVLLGAGTAAAIAAAWRAFH